MQKKLLLFAIFLLIAFLLITSDLFRPVAKRDPLPAPLDIQSLKKVSPNEGAGDKVSATLSNIGDINDQPRGNSSQVYRKSHHNYTVLTNLQSVNITKKADIDKEIENISRSKEAHEVTHIEFLKVHKAASSTVQSIILRFGLKRNLSFAIPTPTHYISTQKYFFSDIWPPLYDNAKKHGTVDRDLLERASPKYDILSHHMVFNHKKVSKLLHDDTVYIAIVRDPFDVFVSAACYYKFAIKRAYPYLEKLNNDTFIYDLLRNPRQHEATTMSESMTYNSMSYDFGLDFHTVKQADEMSEEKFAKFLNMTGDTFHLVMLVEKFDESLVLLKRYLNWSLQDILYVKINTFSAINDSHRFKKSNLTEDDMRIFRKRNRLDYGLYNYSKSCLESQIKREEFFMEEVKHFQNVLLNVQNFCSKMEEDLLKANKHMQNTEKYTSDFKGYDLKPVEHVHIKNTSDTNVSTVIQLILNTKEVLENQRNDLYKLMASMDGKSLKITETQLLKLLPLLFRDKVNHAESASTLLIPRSNWNQEFVITSRDCHLMSKDIMSLYETVKQNHLRILIENKFGDNFSVFEAMRYVSNFF